MRRFRLLAAALCALVCTLPLAAAAAGCGGKSLAETLTEAERAEIAGAVAATPYPRGLLWTARRDGAELRLVGTMHIHDPRNGPLIDRIAPLLDGAGLVLLELTPAEEAAVQAAMVEDPDRLFITAGPTLPDLLDDATWQALAAAARDRQIPAFMAAKFRPWYLSMSLAMPPCAMADLVAGRRGVDHAIMDAAGARGLPMAPLEPWDTLFALMERGTEAEQIEMLRLSLVPAGIQEASVVAMLDGYFAGEVAEVWEMSRIAARRVPGLDPDEADALFAELQRDLLDTRNRAWVPVIEAAAADHPVVVVAVGAAHLPGEAGVLRLLEGAGWTVAPAE